MKYNEEIAEIRTMINETLNKENNAFKITDYFNINELTENDVLSIAIDLSIFVIGNGYGNKLCYSFQNSILNESTDKTLPIKDVKKELMKQLHFKEWQITEDNGANNIKLILLFVDLNINEEIIVKEMESCGWSKSYITPPSIIYGQRMKAMSFDPIFQDNVNDEVRKSTYLFHWTPLYNINNILFKGLIPKSDNHLFDYPPHVYLMKENIPEDVRLFLGWQLCQNNDNPKNDGNYLLYKINIKDIPENVDFFYDPRFEYGYYTNQQIPPYCMDAIQKIKYNKGERTYNKDKNIITYL